MLAVWRWTRHSLYAVVVAALASAVACTTLPDEPPREPDYADAPSESGPLQRAAAAIDPPMTSGDSAFRLIPGAGDALAWRITLIDSAIQSIDAQYFVWHGDAAGTLLLERLFAAADRGVKVRLLVDDLHLATSNTLKGIDPDLAAVDYHPNFELRLFNPGQYRSGTIGAASSMASDSPRYNRRMHNKMLLVDGHFAIVGGRNVGNEYYGLDEAFNFVDLDILVAGAVIPEISTAFDQYWNAEMVYPAGALTDTSEAEHRALLADNRQYLESKRELLLAFEARDHTQRLAELGGTMHRGQANFYQDDPVKRGTERSRLLQLLTEVAPQEEGDHDVLYSTPYMIPAANFLELLETDEEAGVRVRLLTNSLATNNQPAVHSHYKKYRDTFLDMGVELFELHHQPAGNLRRFIDTPPVTSEHIGLHMKAAVINDDRCFLGTLNFDPRSIDINTENVLFVESQALCGEVLDYIEGFVQPEAAWSVTRDEDGDLQWTSFEGSVDLQPARDTSQRLMDSIYRLLPEDQL
jgi:putative cardiolipin synthase